MDSRDRFTKSVARLLAHWSKPGKHQRIVARDVPWLAVMLDKAASDLATALREREEGVGDDDHTAA